MLVTPTTFQEVFDFFESSFQDKHIIPVDLETVWLLRAIARYSVEINPIEYDEQHGVFAEKLDISVIDVLSLYMKKFYQEREVSKVNKRVSIVTKDFSWDGAGHTKTAEKNHLDFIDSEVRDAVDNLKPPAYL